MKFPLVAVASTVCTAATHAERAAFEISFPVVPTTSVVNRAYVDRYAIPHSVDARRHFPPEDIMIRAIDFHGVFADGKEHIPYHHEAEAHGLPNEAFHLVYHHQVIHFGSKMQFYRGQDSVPENDNTWIMGSGKDVTSWAHAPFGFGSSYPKAASFKPFGVRLRPEAAVFACLHAKNTGNATVNFVAKWEIEFERLASPAPDPRALLGAWLVLPPGFQHALEPTEGWAPTLEDAVSHFSFTIEVAFGKDVRVRGYQLHRHAWLIGMKVRTGKGDVLLSTGPTTLAEVPMVLPARLNRPRTPSTGGDGEYGEYSATELAAVEARSHIMMGEDTAIRWLRPREGGSAEVFAEGLAGGGVPIAAGESLFADIVAERITARNNGPLSMSWLFTCNDGTDHVEYLDDVLKSTGIDWASVTVRRWKRKEEDE